MLGDPPIPDTCSDGRLFSYQIIPGVTRIVCQGGYTIVGRRGTATSSTHDMDSAIAEDAVCLGICTIRLIQQGDLYQQAVNVHHCSGEDMSACCMYTVAPGQLYPHVR